MQLISYLSSFISCYNSSASLSLAKRNALTLELNEENIKDFQHTSLPPSSEGTQLFYQQIKRLPGLSYFFKKYSKSEKKSLDYTEILNKLENNKLINFDQIKQKILSLVKQEENYFLAREGNIQKYFYRIENILTNLWGDIAVATDGFNKLTAFTSIKLMDSELEAWLDVKKFRHAALKELLCRFNSDQLASIFAKISLDQLTDLIADVAPISQQPQQSNQRIRVDINQTIRQEIDKRLLNSLQDAKNILSHPGLQFLGKSDLPYWQATLAASSLNSIRRLTKTAQTLHTLTQYSEAPLPLHSAANSLYNQLLTELTKYQNRFHIQALQELKKALQELKQARLILQEYSPPPLDLNKQMIKCWENLGERLAERFHHVLISTHSAQDIIHSIHDLLLACEELSAFPGTPTNTELLQRFIDHSLAELGKSNQYRRNQLANQLASAPINELRKSLSDALQLDNLEDLKSNNLNIKYLDKYPLQKAQIQQMIICLQMPSESRSFLSSFPHQLFNYFFAPHPLAINYRDAIRDIFKIEISISAKPKQKQNVFVRVLRGDVPTETAEEIQALLHKKNQELLQKKNQKEHSANAWMKDCDIDAQYITDASRGVIKDIAFNGKRVFNELNKGEETEAEEKRRPYIVASLLRNFWRSDKSTGIASAYISQTLFNLMAPILPINGVVTLPEGKAVTALLSKNYSMSFNVISPNKSNSARIEATFKHMDINQVLTSEGPTPLKQEGNHLHLNATIEVNQDQVNLAGQKISFDYSLASEASFPSTTR